MWSKVAEEMAVPWRAAEAMHWQLGEADMARRAGVVPFSLSNVTMEAPPSGHRSSPSRGHSHSQSQSSIMSNNSTRFSRPATSGSHSNHSNHSNHSQNHNNNHPNISHSAKNSGGGSARTIAARRESTPRSVPPASPSDGLALAAIGGGGGFGGGGFSGMNMNGMNMNMGRGAQLLPSVAEMTTGVSPYNTPAYAYPMAGGYSSPGGGLMLPSIGMMQGRPEQNKRRGSPDMGPTRETSRRRQ